MSYTKGRCIKQSTNVLRKGEACPSLFRFTILAWRWGVHRKKKDTASSSVHAKAH